MRPLTLALRSLTHYWRTNLAVIAGVAIAVSVLAGALVVGESVRASLRELAVGRLGKADHLVASTGFFRAALADEIAQQPRFREGFSGAVGLIAVDGMVADGGNSRRASGVAIYGVDERFFAFHDVSLAGEPLTGRQALLSPALAGELRVKAEDDVLVRLQQPSAVPVSTLHGRRDEVGRAIRATVREVLPASKLGEFSLRPQQGEVRAIFLPLARLQRDLDRPDRVNALLVSEKPGASDAAAALESILTASFQLSDAGLKIRGREDFSVSATGDGEVAETEKSSRPLIVESDSGLLTEAIVAAARKTIGTPERSTPVFAYLADTIRVGERTIPYAVVAGVELERMRHLFGDVPVLRAAADPRPDRPIWLNTWAAERLEARPGDRVTIAYDVWEDDGGMVPRSAELTLAGILPMQGIGADPSLTPEYPGISDQTSVADWDPAFPIDLSRITPADEQYWDEHRAAPKAFVPYAIAEELWASRFGRMTSLRIAAPPERSPEQAASALTRALSLADAGLILQPVRARALEASSGTTDFGQYFLYFSFFLVVSGLLLTGLFFRVGIEQRLREIGLLEAVGLTPGAVRGLFVREGALLAALGALIGVAGALGYAWLIMLGLRTWWVGAVGTTALTLRASPLALASGALAGLITAVLVIVWMLRQVSRASVPMLLKGALDAGAGAAPSPAAQVGRHRRRPRTGGGSPVRIVATAALALLLVASGLLGLVAPAGAFFGAGAAAMATGLFALSWWLRRPPSAPSPGAAWRRLAHVGVANASARPGRSVLSVALIAFATFVIVAVGAFRRDSAASVEDPASGAGGYTLIAEAVAPLMYDPLTPAGREAYGLTSPEAQPTLDGLTIARFRLRPGDDGSCLNLYRPENPRIVAPEAAFVDRGGRFTFAGSRAATEAERTNPWLLLNHRLDGGAIPAIVDATSLQYVFHKSIGDDIVVERTGQAPLRLQVVASLSHSVFQSEIVIGEANFLRLFPQNEGYRVWLIDAPAERQDAVATLFESRLSDLGLEVSATADRLRAYEQVENTYLSTFQALGALGLVLGTFGLGAVLVRNILERQREVALLQAVGYRRAHVRALVASETALLVVAGLAIGAGCALLAVQPALAAQGGGVPFGVIAGVAGAVIVAGLAATLVATAVATRLPLLAALKSE